MHTRNPAWIVLAALAAAALARAESPGDARRFWPQWRGPEGTGVAPLARPPTTWGDDKNIRWKVELPGSGHATPIVWNDRIYIQTAVKTDKQGPAPAKPAEPEERRPGRRRRGGGDPPTHVYRFVMLALDRKTGKTVWERTLTEAVPHEAGHTDATQASASPLTDGEHLIAYFGSRGLYGLDMQGKVLWSTDLGDMQTRNGFGEGSSPALYGDTVVVSWDHEGDDFIIALDKRTGKQLWKQPRDEPTSWTTPVIIESNGKPQVVTCASDFIRCYDLKTGQEIWKCSGMTANTIPTPVVGGDILYCISGFHGNALLAIRYPGASGDLTGSKAVVWTYDRYTPYVPSPLLCGDTLYFFDNNRAIVSCLDPRTGKEHYERQRLDASGVYASPVAADGRVYLVCRDGKTVVLKQGKTFEILATNSLSDGFDASPAVVDGELFLRGRKHLYCIAEGS